MNPIWEKIESHIIKFINAKNIALIGSESELNTIDILEYCSENQGHLTIVDPLLNFNIEDLKEKYGEIIEIYQDISLNKFTQLKDCDVILINNAQDWFTAYNDLKIIENYCETETFPLTFIHDIYLPQTNESSLDGLNESENIFKALEDFVNESNGKLAYDIVPVKTGLGIIYPKNDEIKSFLDSLLENSKLSEILEEEKNNIDQLYYESKKEEIRLKKEYEQTKQKFQELKEQTLQDNLKLRAQLEHEEKKVEDTEEDVEHLNELLQEKESIIQSSKKTITKLGKLDSQINKLTVNFYENEYYQNSNRSISQRIISKFPSLFLLLRSNNGLKPALMNIKGYKSIKNNNLFDIGYYLKNYPDIRASGKDPILHYILYGYKEGRKPSSSFDGDYYLKKYKDVRNQNPLVHYALFGMKEGRVTDKKVKKMVENYELIANSGLFNSEWYKNKYKIDPKVDPIKHFLNIGVKKFYNPNPSFDTRLYLKNYLDVKKVGINPLIHYILYGKIDNRKYPMFDDAEFYKYTVQQEKNILKALNPVKKLSIIIPIYNAYEETKKCIVSVFENTKIPYELILIDDFSSDERIGLLMDEMEKISNVKVIRNPENKGFVKSCNIGMQNSDGDIVLLNSDTIVTPKWLQKLVVAAYSDEKIGTVTPFSNSSDIQLPEMVKNNDNQEDLSIDEMSNLVEKTSTTGNIVAPTGNGFCLFIKRETIEDIGIFDEENFGEGYGEETDFSMRARNKRWINIRNDSIFIYHKRHASFSDEKTDELQKRNRVIIEKKHPTTYEDWHEFKASKILRTSINNIKSALNDYDPRKIYKKRILYVSYSDSEGNPRLNEDFFKIQDNYEVIILTLDVNSKILKLSKYDNNNFLTLNKMDLKTKWDLTVSKNFYFNLLINLKIDALVVLESIVIKKPIYRNHSSFIRVAHDLGLELIYDTKTISNTVQSLEELFESDNSDDEIIKNEINKIDFNRKKLAVYTAITGDYDELLTPEYVNHNFDYICFTDNINLKSDFWEIRLVEELDLDNVRKARRYKVLPHVYLADYDYSLWVDGGFKIVGNLEELITKYAKNHKMMCIVHETRNSIYKEAEECISRKNDSEKVINSQINKYLAEGYPKNQGLIASGVLFRDHKDENVIKLMNDWYNEIINYSKRDQLSFNFVSWKNGFEYDECHIYYWNNEYFTHKGSHKVNKNVGLEYESVMNYDVSQAELEENHELMSKFLDNPRLELNNAIWFVPFFDHVYRGGIYTIFRTAQYFSIKEGTNNIFCLYGKEKKDLKDYETELSEAFPQLNFQLINKNYVHEKDLPYSDAAFCTLWNSAYSLVKYNNCKAKFYFNQDYEPLFYSAGSLFGLAEQTYRFGFIGVTNTQGVAEAYKRYGNKLVKYFTPSVDSNVFYPDYARKKDKFRIVFYGRPINPRNGFYLGIEALKKVKEHFKDEVEIFSVGSEFNSSEYDLEGVLENLGLLPTIEDVAELYRSCDLGLVFMFTPHPSYQPLEYMASGCVTVTNINENNIWLLKDQENAILTEPTVSCIADNIINLLENKNLREKIITNGLKTTQFTNWENELNKLVDFIKNPKEL